MSTRPAAPPLAEVQRFVGQLPRGKSNAVTAADLCARLGLAVSEDHKRQVRLLAQHAVDMGWLVVADGNGYYIPASADEAEESLARLESQITYMSERVRRVRSLVAQQFPTRQMTLL